MSRGNALVVRVPPAGLSLTFDTAMADQLLAWLNDRSDEALEHLAIRAGGDVVAVLRWEDG